MDDKIPKYLQLKQEIESWLGSGRFKPDDQMPSEHEIAARFGISRQTVRQTLGELVNEGLLYRVQGKGTFAAKPKAKAVQDTPLIGVITTYISDYIFPQIVRGVEAGLRDHGYALILSSTDNDKQKERNNLSIMLAQPIRGLIVEPTKSAQGNPNLDLFLALQLRDIPIIMVNERYPELYCPCLKVDDEAGGYAAAEHLIQLGHRAIAGFFKTDDLQGANRLKGFMRAFNAHRIQPRPDFITIYSTEEKDEKPLYAALSLLRGEDPPTAFVCYNDELALVLLEAAKHAGISVPEDLSIIGFDDSLLASAGGVKLTTLAHPKEEMGARAASLILNLVDKGPSSVEHDDILYTPELIVRATTASPKFE